MKNESEICEFRRRGSCFLCALRHGKPPQLWRSSKFKKAQEIDLMIYPTIILEKMTEVITVKNVVLPNFAPLPPINIPPTICSDYFLFVGALEKHKGILDLIEVFRRLRGNTSAKLLIAGEGSLKENIRNLINEYSLNNSIQLLGTLNREDLYSLYKGAYSIVVPSVWPENSPLVIVEALSVGTPAIVSNIGGLPEIAEKIDKTLIYNYNELEELLITLSSDKSKKICPKIFENFAPKIYVDKYLDLIHAM